MIPPHPLLHGLRQWVPRKKVWRKDLTWEGLAFKFSLLWWPRERECFHCVWVTVCYSDFHWTFLYRKFERISHGATFTGSMLENSTTSGHYATSLEYKESLSLSHIFKALYLHFHGFPFLFDGVREELLNFPWKTHKQEEGNIYVPPEKVAAWITEHLQWNLSYSKTTTFSTQQKKMQYSTFSWEDLVFFSKLHIKTHIQWKHSLSRGHQSRGNLQTKPSQMRSFLQTVSLGNRCLRPWRRGWGGIIPFPLKAVVDGHFLFPLSYFTVMLAFQ